MSQNPDEQATTPNASPASGAMPPAFLPPRNPQSSRRRQPSNRSLSPSQGVPEAAADEAGDGSASDEATPPESTPSFPASTEAPAARFRPIDPSTRKLYAEVVEQGALIASGLVNSRMDPEGNAFVMRPDEAEGVAAPASRLLARHVPLSAAVAGQATDLSDIVELVTALIGYAMSAFSRRAAGMVDGTGMPTGDEGDTSDYHPEQETAAAAAPSPRPAWPVPGMAPMVRPGA